MCEARQGAVGISRQAEVVGNITVHRASVVRSTSVRIPYTLDNKPSLAPQLA